MSWTDSTKRVLAHPFASLYHGTLFKGKRLSNETLGYLNSNYRSAQLYTSLKRFKSREKYELKGMKASIKEIERVKKRLSGFNKNTFTRVFKAYHNKPDKLRTVIGDIVQEYIVDLNSFSKNTNDFLILIRNNMNDINNLRSNVNFDLITTIDELDKAAKNGLFNMPSETLDAAKRNISNQLDRQERRLEAFRRRESVVSYRFKNNQRVSKKVGYMGMTGWYFSTKRKINKYFSSSMMERIFELKEEIDKQKKSGFKADFLAILEEYVSYIEQIYKISVYLEEDVNKSLQVLMHDYQAIQQSIARFIAIFGKEEGIKDINLVRLNTSKTNIINELNKEKIDYSQCYKDLDTLKHSVESRLETIKDHSDAIFNELKNKKSAESILKKMRENV